MSIQRVSVLRTAALLMLAMAFCSSHASAQELLSNRSFESPVASANGNNFYATIPSWTVVNVAPAQAQPFNIVRPWSGYAGNPTSTPTGGGLQYFDVNAASGDLRQTVTISAPGMVDLSGWFSVRDNQQALSGLTINLRDSAGSIVATASTSFLSSDPIGLWKRVGSDNIPVTAGTYIFEVVIPNPANFDLASLVFKPNLSVIKTSTPISDPSNGASGPKLIPGGIVEYTLTATSPASYVVTSNSIRIADSTPANMELVVANIGGAGSGPAAFNPATSGLTYSFASLNSTTDRVDFSNNNGLSWTYTPTANANGVDPNVTTIRLRPQGTMAAASTFSFRVRYRIK
ncbi:MAG: hypothetical protein ACXW3Z_16440 [Limisphaerales bacterium]